MKALLALLLALMVIACAGPDPEVTPPNATGAEIENVFDESFPEEPAYSDDFDTLEDDLAFS